MRKKIMFAVKHSEPLKNSDYCIFYQKPSRVDVNHQPCLNFTDGRIETLIERLLKGPLVAYGKFGPSTYLEEPFQLKNKYHGCSLYGWKPGSHQIEEQKDYIILLGAKKTKDYACIYFTMAKKIDLMPFGKLNSFKPSNIEERIFVNSFAKFNANLSSLYLRFNEDEIIKNSLQNYEIFHFITSAPHQMPTLLPSQEEYVNKLLSFDLESILDRKEGEAKCHRLGQEIFDRYKSEANDDTFAGKEAVQNICDAIHFHRPDGRLRKQYIERAWDGIGDDEWRWMA